MSNFLVIIGKQGGRIEGRDITDEALPTSTICRLYTCFADGTSFEF